MGEGILGGGVLLVAMAGLWLAYLLPAWFRRKEYLATERNAVRLQQTLRIMAETSDMPDEVRAEVTGRGVDQQRKALKQLERLQRKAVKQETKMQLKKAKAQIQVPRKQVASAAGRLRRSRLITSLVVLAAVVVGVVGFVQLVAGVSLAGFVVLVAGGVVVAGVSVLRRLAGTTLAPLQAEPVKRPSLPLVDYAAMDAAATGAGSSAGSADAVAADAVPTVPAVPKPRYLASPRVPLEVPDEAARRAAAASLRAAALRSAEALREAERAVPTIDPFTVVAPPVPAERPAASADRPAARSAESRWSSMGRVDDVETGFDVDSVLQRRRNAG